MTTFLGMTIEVNPEVPANEIWVWSAGELTKIVNLASKAITIQRDQSDETPRQNQNMLT